MQKPFYSVLFRRYIWLVDTVSSAGHISKEEIDRRWAHNTSLNDEREISIPDRTFHRHREAVSELFGLDIDYDRSSNTYYIGNASDFTNNEVRQWLINSFSVSNLLEEAHEMRRHILFEPVPSGQRYLTTLIEAIRDSHAVEMTYRRFSVVSDGVKLSDNKPHTFFFEPYCLKCFKQRWYVVGRKALRDVDGKQPSADNNTPRVYALDRVLALTPTDRHFTAAKDFDPETFFLYCYGVSGMFEDPEVVRVKVDEQQANYMRSLPLHPSQQEIERTEDYSIFSFFLVPNTEFRQALWQHAAHLEILAPEWLREETAYEVKHLYLKYWK